MSSTNLRLKLQQDIKEAMLKRDAVLLETLRYIWSEIKNQEIDLKTELTDDQVITLLKREVKKRKDAISQFIKGNRQELADQEQTKVELIAQYLPAAMSEIEIKTIVDTAISTGLSDFGSIMKYVMTQTQGQADGATVSRLVKEKLG